MRFELIAAGSCVFSEFSGKLHATFMTPLNAP